MNDYRYSYYACVSYDYRVVFAVSARALLAPLGNPFIARGRRVFVRRSSSPLAIPDGRATACAGRADDVRCAPWQVDSSRKVNLEKCNSSKVDYLSRRIVKLKKNDAVFYLFFDIDTNENEKHYDRKRSLRDPLFVARSYQAVRPSIAGTVRR